MNGLLSEAQHGFVPGRSCVSQLLQVLEDWTRYIDSDTPVDAIYLDFKKAFDSVAHERLMIALESLGITGELLNWIRNFLTGRLQSCSGWGSLGLVTSHQWSTTG